MKKMLIVVYMWLLDQVAMFTIFGVIEFFIETYNLYSFCR